MGLVFRALFCPDLAPKKGGWRIRDASYFGRPAHFDFMI
jgi:hypothetical protein